MKKAKTKMDLAESEEWVELVAADVSETLEGTALKGAPIIPVSARTGQGPGMSVNAKQKRRLGHGKRAEFVIENIIREEMNAIGGQEITMPVVHPADLWQETGRWYEIGAEMGLFAIDAEYVGPGMPLWLPKGTVLVEELERLLAVVRGGGTEPFAAVAGFRGDGFLRHSAKLEQASIPPSDARGRSRLTGSVNFRTNATEAANPPIRRTTETIPAT